MTIKPHIILASSSIYRQKQLAQLHINFKHISPDIDERIKQGEQAEQLAYRLSQEKALKIQKSGAPDGAIIIGSDQSAQFGDTILGKPNSTENAIKQLLECSSKQVTFYSGVCVAQNETLLTRTVPTTVKFRTLTEKEITNYVTKDNPIHCAGSFKCESLGISLFETITSEDPSALTGLPLITLNLFFIKLGANPLLI